jgi:outer membrane translocation and assembly module TamA
MESSTPFNWIIEKGVFQAFQIAFFHEIGQVSPKNDSNLYRDFKSSTGMGLRIVFSSVVLRADVASGSEGSEQTVFIGYGF